MGSNISRDHIAMEAMKEIMRSTARDTTPFWHKIAGWFGYGKTNTGMLPANQTARRAYEYADAMIAERERTKK